MQKKFFRPKNLENGTQEQCEANKLKNFREDLFLSRKNPNIFIIFHCIRNDFSRKSKTCFIFCHFQLNHLKVENVSKHLKKRNKHGKLIIKLLYCSFL